MYLKRLVLQGYKTFATKTEFAFDEGITSIVGPNGSGKSNIADAVRWVLGEQSYSALRGKRTIDMIFAGSQSRPRAGMAQAILTLDNGDGWLPIDYTEVEIGRRAYRSGENEYILNGQKVRLKDITQLLASSGLAERTYTIIGQGLVDKALSLRAEERRALFEEAAGISHYKSKRAETLRRLQETQRNLERVHDILAEIKPRLSSLKRQATRARNYEQISIDLRHLLRIWYGYRWERAKDEMRLARETADQAETLWQESRDALLAQQEKIDAQRRLINRGQRELDELTQARDEARARWEKSRREAAILRERRSATERQLSDVEEDLPALREQQAAARSELAAATAELEAAQANLDAGQIRLLQFNSDFQAQQAEINRRQAALRQSERERRESQTRLAQAEGQLSQLRERVSERQAAGDEADEMVKVEAEIGRMTAVLESARSSRDNLRSQREAAQKSRRALIDELKGLRRDNRDAERALQKRRTALARLEARIDLLAQMRRKETAVGSDEAAVIGQFASLIAIPDEYQIALEAALAARLETLVVPDSAILWRLLNNADPDQTVIVAALDSIVNRQSSIVNHPGIIARGADLVTGDERIRPLIELLLGSIVLVENAAAAHSVAQELPAGMLAVTPDGFVAHAGGLVERMGRGAGSAVLAREAEWQKARAEGEKQAAEAAKMATAVAAQQTVIQEKQNNVDELQREEHRLGRLEGEANQRAGRAGRDLDRTKQQLSFLERQRRTQAEENARLSTRIERTERLIGTGREEIVRLETAVGQARAQLESLPVAEAQQQRQSLQQTTQAAQTIVAGRQAAADSRRATLNQADRQIARLEERGAALRRQLEQLTLTDEEANAASLRQELVDLDAKIKPLQERIRADQRKLAGMEEGTAVIQKQTHERETQHTQTQIALSQRQNKMDGLQERIKADLGIVALSYDADQTGPTPLPMGEVVESLPVVAELPDDIEDTIQRYRGQMQRMGAVNPDAPDEYVETQERFDFMTQQVEDLNQTEAQLRQVIAELDDLTSRAFAQTVEKVNAVFGDIFTRLFGGGSGRLALTDPDDLTISGVDIIARLPNRREQGLALLSGGERSLTAAALIFSLLKVSPTPFCVMDEVDAALDEANINRFRELLRELSLQTQFIVITHNRGTVQAAQTIYGISMGGDSASQSISIKPEEYVKQASLV
ncbi:MAG: chromosome segregation protein SMC [Chloroflexi bacterium]|nr:chromosome segregation protein SMC [Chloroflexota bacterium]